VSDDFRLLDVTALDEPEFRPHVLTRGFWQGWRHYQRPVIVTFNGRGYDLPVLELSAFRYGLALSDWFSNQGPTYDQPRHRYNAQSHLDLMDLLSNFGAVRMTGGLNLLANLIGKPGKTQVDGSQVQEMYDRGETEAINGYCRCDVLDTYFVFLRTRVLVGQITLEREQELVEEARQWLETRRESCSAFDHYLKHWGLRKVLTLSRSSQGESIVRVASCPNNSIVSALLDRAAAHARAHQHGFAVAFFSAAVAADDTCHAQLQFGLYSFENASIAAACLHLANAYRSLGNADLARQYHQLALAAELKTSTADGLPPLLSDAARQGSAADRRDELGSVSEGMLPSGEELPPIEDLLSEGIAQFRAGERSDALATFAQVYRRSRAVRDWSVLATVTEWLGELFRTEGEWESAAQLFSVSARLHRSTGLNATARRLEQVAGRIDRALAKLSVPAEWN
ncbi:DNA_pol_B_exo2 domain-containing protein, partial [Durusdinium trenchii]